ncbi:hypothetical protein [Flavobacterium mesophilum]|uniref:hypothetical protein n=1 Tax=Flavobacterium mesophilum TaxID=3143495 RepID=UPI0031D34D4C
MKVLIKAIDVKKCILKTQNTISISDLPVILINPFLKGAKIAILSWKRDIMSGKSKNLFICLVHAKNEMIDFLLVDIISIQQDSKDLINDVAVFSEMYKTIPVIAAYDWKCDNWIWTMRRPWICYEIHKYCTNPNSITYLGYAKKQGNDLFEHMLQRIVHTTFAQTILYLLLGKITMAKLIDLKLLLPNYSSIVQVAYEKMSRNDFLLTTCILALNDIPYDNNEFPYTKYRVNGDQDFSQIVFLKYEIREQNSSIHRTNYSISLDGQKIANLFNNQDNMGESRTFLEPLPNNIDIIINFLNISKSSIKDIPLPIKSHNLEIPNFKIISFKI